MRRQTPSRIFPFSAVVGQGDLKKALILAMIDPRLGGVLISGHRGSAKSTLARGMAELGPGVDHPFVTLPLGASEEQLTGSLDLQQVVEQRQVKFSPGLLAKAHQGVLYIDEVNLLPDPLVDALLDVAASGINYVERDGVSHSHAADFLLVGTMNPDEGDLRPQLKDRFGLAVELMHSFNVQQRMQIVQQRLAFDQDPKGFNARFAERQIELRTRIAGARERLHHVACPEEQQQQIAELCIQSEVEGVRADLSWRRAACAYAAWSGRAEVSVVDVEAVGEFVLCHRRKHKPQHTEPPSGGAPKYDSQKNASTDDTAQGDWGAMSPEKPPTGSKRILDSTTEAPVASPKNARCTRINLSTEALPGAVSGKKGNRSGLESAQIDWYQTFISSDNRNASGIKRLKRKRMKTGSVALSLILLDTSASTLGKKALATAKGLVLGIAEQAYLARQQLAILTFGNQKVEWLLSAQRAPKDISPLLSDLGAGGGTPLRQALMLASSTLRKLQKSFPLHHCRTFLLTDGRSRDSVSDLQWQSPLWVVDIEQGSVKLGRCRGLAKQLSGVHLPITDTQIKN